MADGCGGARTRSNWAAIASAVYIVLAPFGGVNAQAPETAVQVVPDQRGELLIGSDDRWRLLSACDAGLSETVPKDRQLCEELAATALHAGLRSFELAAERTSQLAEHQSGTEAHLRQVLSEQAFHSRVLFWMVIAIVTLGIAAASAHFIRALRGHEEGSLDIMIAREGVRVKLSMVGVILMVASMLFFTVYVYIVFPITAI